MNNYDAEWTNVWPGEPGNYWFFGHRSRDAQVKGFSEPELTHVKVRKCGDRNLFYVADGGFFFPQEVGDGLWTPSLTPNLPETK